MKSLILGLVFVIGTLFTTGIADAHDRYPVRNMVHAAVCAPVRVMQARPVRSVAHVAVAVPVQAVDTVLPAQPVRRAASVPRRVVHGVVCHRQPVRRFMRMVFVEGHSPD